MNDASASDNAPTNLEVDTSNDASSRVAAGGGSSTGEQKNRSQKERKTTFLCNLIRNIDIMIYCELSILYYMDCSLLQFLFRALPHWFYFTPKPDIFPPPLLTHRPYVGTIFGSNLCCILLHILIAPPSAGEASHVYLNGGLMMDFVGQESPVSRFRLLWLDLITLALQVLMLAVTIEKEKVTGVHAVSGAPGSGSETRQQDHDLEERGMLRSDPNATDDIEMRDLQHTSEGRTGGDEDGERDGSLAVDGVVESHDVHPLDSFYTGEHIVANLHILDTIREQWHIKSVIVAPDASGSDTTTEVRTAGSFFGNRVGFFFEAGTAADGQEVPV